MRRAFRCRRIAALVCVVGCVGVACGVGSPPPPISQASLVAHWANDEGVRIAFASDHTLRAVGLDHAPGAEAGSCPAATKGRWDFFGPVNDSGSSSSDESLTRGGMIAVHGKDGKDDTCTFIAVTRKDGQAFGLCLAQDPEPVCTDDETLRRSRPVRSR
ncbi:hypothetical protein [Streptomyces sp. NPDC060188]|uniref:hypothetical protein n=1 Tax=Streptomyces sp. NPDC060188 TaxID=3347068 RepID=UPI0036464D73